MSFIEANTTSFLIDALKRTKKGRLEYDNHWKEEGRTQEIVNSIKQNLSAINIPPLPPRNNNGENPSCSTNGLQLRPGPDFDTLDRMMNKLKEKDESNFQSTSDFVKTNNELQNYEQQREIEVLQRLEKRQQELQEKNELLMKNYDDQIRMIQKKYLIESIRMHKKYEDEDRQLTLELEKLKSQVETSPSEVHKNRNLKLKEIEEKQKLLLRQEELKRQQQNEYRDKLHSCKNRINNVIQKVDNHLNELKSKFNNIPDDLNNYRNLLISISQDVEVLLLSKNEYSVEDVQSCENKLKELHRIEEDFLSKVLTFINSSQAKPSGSSIERNVQPLAESNKPLKETLIANSTLDNRKLFKKSKFKSPQEIYNEHQAKYVQFEDLCKRFQDNPSNKQLRTSIQIFIRSIINTICNISVENLKSKLQSLLSMLESKQFEHGGRKVKISENDYSFHFAINTTVKIIINVAMKTRHISFQLAPVIVVLWAYVPMFGEIFLSRLYLDCPYAVPYFPTRSPDQSDLEYMVVCGYQLQTNGKLEPEESFTSRMSSLIELYSSTIGCYMKSEYHPREVHYAWRWLVTILNDQPQDQMTALILDAFISMCADKLLAKYGKQFVKLVNFIQSIYMNEIERVTSADERQSLVKFKSSIKSLLEKISKCRTMPLKSVVEDLQLQKPFPSYFFEKSYIYMRK